MSAEENKTLVRRFMEDVFNRGNLGLVDEIVVADFVEHEELPPGTPPGREGLKALVAQFRGAFPDFQVTLDDVIAEGDRVVVRSTWRGTQRKEFMHIPPSGKRISFEVIDIIRIAGGKFQEHWGQMDSMLLMQQLGAVPAGQPAPA